jgi:hypothetical protein
MEKFVFLSFIVPEMTLLMSKKKLKKDGDLYLE